MMGREDPRVREARRGLALAWLYYTAYVAAIMAAAYLLGGGAHVWGLPRWVAVSCIVVPAVFVAALVPVVERCMHDISLEDEERPEDAP